MSLSPTGALLSTSSSGLLLLQVVGLTCYNSPEEPQESFSLLF